MLELHPENRSWLWAVCERSSLAEEVYFVLFPVLIWSFLLPAAGEQNDPSVRPISAAADHFHSKSETFAVL